MKLRSLLLQIDDSSADMVKAFDLSEWRIREHCDSLRQQGDIARETALENIHKESNTLMTEIDAYEQECLSSLRATKESTERVVKDVSKRMRAFLAEQQEYLRSVQASDTQSIFLFLFEWENTFFFSFLYILLDYINPLCFFQLFRQVMTM